MAEHVDIVVIGGGVVGLCVARALRERGRHVTVVEKTELEAGCSSGNAGLVVPSHVVPLAAPGVIAQGLTWLLRRGSPFRIKPRLDLDLLRWLWRFRKACTCRHVTRSVPVLRDLNLGSRALFEKWERSEEEDDFGFKPSGLLMLHETKKGREKDLSAAERARKAGLEVSILDRDGLGEMSARLPAASCGGVYYHQDALLDPSRLIGVLAGWLERRDVQLRTGTAVTDFERAKGAIRTVHTTKGALHPEEVVLAAGSWSAALSRELDVFLPVQPAKGYSVTFEAPNETPEVPFILTEKKVSVTPLGNRVRFAGTLELAGFDASIDTRRVKPLLDVAAAYVPDVDPDGLVAPEVWTGFRPCTPDGLPVIGRASRYRNLVLATGHCMMGVSLAPITGQLVAEIIEGEAPSIDLHLLQYGRFR